MTIRILHRALASLAVVGLFATGCGGNPPPQSTTTTTTTTTTTSDDGSRSHTEVEVTETVRDDGTVTTERNESATERTPAPPADAPR